MMSWAQRPCASHRVDAKAIRDPSGDTDEANALPVKVTWVRIGAGVTAGAAGRPDFRISTATIASAATLKGATHRTRFLFPVGRTGSAARSSAALNSPALAYRSDGTLASAFTTAVSTPSGTVSRTTRSRVGRSVSSLAITACTVGPVTGGSPASIS